MKIINSSSELNLQDVYKLTKSPSIIRMQDIKGNSISVCKWAIYEDEKTDKDGAVTTTEILSIMDDDGEVYATNSPTFIRSFMECFNLCEMYNCTIDSVQVATGRSKNGREYIDCVMCF